MTACKKERKQRETARILNLFPCIPFDQDLKIDEDPIAEDVPIVETPMVPRELVPPRLARSPSPKKSKKLTSPTKENEVISAVKMIKESPLRKSPVRGFTGANIAEEITNSPIRLLRL